MAEVLRTRTIRPSTRSEKSKNYKIDTKNVFYDDILVVIINHESAPFSKTFKFKGADVADKNSIHFNIEIQESVIHIRWGGLTPIEKPENNLKTELKKVVSSPIIKKDKQIQLPINLKGSFEPISNHETSILILGTMPGDKSLELKQYYGHARNRLWKILAYITKNEIPITYTDKINFLLKAGIGLWDVAHKASRKGSLDNAIQNEEPNDIENFLLIHRNIKIIGFNGVKAETLFNKYFIRRNDITYISLPSSSPANTGINFENICGQWQKLLTKQKRYSI